MHIYIYRVSVIRLYHALCACRLSCAPRMNLHVAQDVPVSLLIWAGTPVVILPAVAGRLLVEDLGTISRVAGPLYS